MMQKRLVIFVCVIMVIVPLFVLTGLRVSQYVDGYSVARLKKERSDLTAELRALKLELSLLKRPERILALAQQKLGMIRISPEKVAKVGAKSE